MLQSTMGLYHQGRVELTEMPDDILDGTPVIVTFLESGHIDLSARGIDTAQAAELRARLSAFTEDWAAPEMDAYDHYDAAKSKL